jgi:hypothetical protein
MVSYTAGVDHPFVFVSYLRVSTTRQGESGLGLKPSARPWLATSPAAAGWRSILRSRAAAKITGPSSSPRWPTLRPPAPP